MFPPVRKYYVFSKIPRILEKCVACKHFVFAVAASYDFTNRFLTLKNHRFLMFTKHSFVTAKTLFLHLKKDLLFLTGGNSQTRSV
jgi:hypothetical protein